MHEMERMEKLEKDLRVTQDSVLLIHKDLQQMNQAMTKMASSVEILANLQTNQKVMEERYETRHNQIKSDINGLGNRVMLLESRDETITKKADKGSTAFSILVWGGSIMGTLMISSIFGVWLWAIAQKGVVG